MTQTQVLTKEEYAPYYQMYFDLVAETNIMEALDHSEAEFLEMVHSISEKDASFAYGVDKWTIKETVQHMIDNERIFSYRALRLSRNDSSILSGYDQSTFVPNSNANDRSLEDLVEEFSILRKATKCQFRSFSDQILLITGIASENLISVRAIGFLMSGHVRHHLNILRDRYLILLEKN